MVFYDRNMSENLYNWKEKQKEQLTTFKVVLMKRKKAVLKVLLSDSLFEILSPPLWGGKEGLIDQT